MTAAPVRIETGDGEAPSNVMLNGVRFTKAVEVALQTEMPGDASDDERRIGLMVRRLLREMQKNGYRGKDARRAAYNLIATEAGRCRVAQTEERGTVNPEAAGSIAAAAASTQQGGNNAVQAGAER